MARKIYVASARGGAGGTTVCVGLGLALSAAGERTLIVDGDRRQPMALNAAGCEGLSTFTLEEARKGACRVKQAIVEHPRSANLSILPCTNVADRKYIPSAVAEAGGAFDYVLCDGTAVSLCDEAIVVCGPYPADIKGADICLNELSDMGCRSARLILNKVNGGLLYDGLIMPPKDIAALLHVELLGVLPEDLALPLGKMRADSVKAIKLAAEKLAGRGDKIYSPLRSYLGAAGFFKRKMRGRI